MSASIIPAESRQIGLRDTSEADLFFQKSKLYHKCTTFVPHFILFVTQLRLNYRILQALSFIHFMFCQIMQNDDAL